MATDFKDIRAAIVDKITNQSGTKVQAVYPYEKSTFEGFPAVIVVPTDNEAAPASTKEDRITYHFKVKAYYQIPEEGDHAEAEIALEEVIDQLLTLFRTRSVLGSACLWVIPAPGTWFYEDRNGIIYRAAEITLKCVNLLPNT